MNSLRKRVAMLAVAGVATAAIGFGATALTRAGETANGASTTKPATRPGAGDKERHPEIRRALMGLREAKRSLEAADHDFDGHRVAALKDVDDGIKELEEALKVDTK
jgi:hypothetical protein